MQLWVKLLYMRQGGECELALASVEMHRHMEQKMMLAYLLRLNQYALDKELITKEVYKKMEIAIIKKYGINHD